MKKQLNEEAPTFNDVAIPPKEIVQTKTWVIKVINYRDGSYDLHRTNDGFSPLELLGLCGYTAKDIRAQMKGKIKPNLVTRTVIDNKDE